MRIVYTVLPIVAACNFDVPDLNNPGIDQLEENPTRVNVGAASTGLLIGNRANTAQSNGLIVQLGILGREAYNFDVADPRFIGELLQSELDQGSPFGGNFWQFPYANIRIANIVQQVAGQVPDYSDEEESAVLGFSRTLEAMDLLVVAITHDTNGGVIDTDRDLDQKLGAIVGKDELLAEIAALLDEGAEELAIGGETFPFGLSNGYAGFDTPPAFFSFNRAIRARVAVYQEDWTAANDALAGSFLDDQALTVEKLNVGVFHSYSTGAGDQVDNLIDPNIYTHPGIAAGAEAGDARLTRKTAETEPGSAAGLTSDRVFTIYTSPDSPVPILRNEELILLRAEVRLRTSDLAGAQADLDLIRTVSGGLPVLPVGQTEDQLEDQLVYNRVYSLLFEGHRLVDARRLGRTGELPLDVPSDADQSPHVLNVRWPIPAAECNARGGTEKEPACALGSQD